MSIRKLQIERAISDLARILYSEGVEPTLGEVLRLTSEHFSEFPPGQPLPVDLNLLSNGSTSNPEAYNELMARVLVNLNFLYEASQEQVGEIMDLTTQLRDNIRRLNDRRRRVEAQVDDYLLSIYNSDGYFFSASDSFSDLSLSDMTMTTAYVDTEGGKVTLPMVSHLSDRLGADRFGSPLASVVVGGTQTNQFSVVAPFSNAVDGLTNTFFSIEVETTAPAEVICTVRVPLGELGAPPALSRIEIDPYGTTVGQWTVGYESEAGNGTFGNKILTTRDRFSLSNDVVEVEALVLRVIKTLPDYERHDGNVIRYRYIFGMKDLVASYQVYDRSAFFASGPLTVPAELAGDMVIDAVSLVTDASIPNGTSIRYYIAEDTGGTRRSDFDWRSIDPVNSNGSGDQVVHFNGAEKMIRVITDDPKGSELERIQPDSINTDLTKRNPSPSILQGLDVYRLAKFDDTPLLSSLRLDEGVNMVRVYHRTLGDDGHDLVWWTDRESTSQVTYAQIDVGNGFFYGGDVGESARSVYVETFLEVLDDEPPLLAEMKKVDDNSQTWKVTAFLNGREVGSLPVGTNTAVVPWTFRKGINHVVLTIDIPSPTTTNPNPYVGTLDLLGDSDLFDHGLVRLDAWQYADPFHMQWNQLPDASVFTIKNGEIITLKEPTGNYRLSYSRDTTAGPSALRFAAELTRDSQFSTTTPELNQYRLRFSYG